MKRKKNTKIKEKKSCYIVEEETRDESDEHDDEVYVAMKEKFDEDEATALVTFVNMNDRQIIDSGCSHHMTGEKIKFITLNCYEVNSVRFGNDAPCLIKGKGSIKLIDKCNTPKLAHCHDTISGLL